MSYGRQTSMGASSVYSHMSKSNKSLRSSKSMHSIVVPWYRKPILQDAVIIDIQRGSLITGFYSLFLSLFTIGTSVFDIYCLAQAAPGSTHYGYYIISFEFVYVGGNAVRNSLVVFAFFTLLGGIIILVTSIILVISLRKEHEKKMLPWLYSFGIFTVFRLFVFVFGAIVNDMIFGYNIAMCFLWTIFTAANIYGWLLVYSLYLELSDLTKLEDLAHLRMGTMASLNASTTHSLAGSRPTTPHSTVSTAPA